MAVSANDDALLSPAAGTSAALVESPVMKKVTLNVPSEGRSTAAIAAGAARIGPTTRAPNILIIVVLAAPRRLATMACLIDRRYGLTASVVRPSWCSSIDGSREPLGPPSPRQQPLELVGQPHPKAQPVQSCGCLKNEPISGHGVAFLSGPRDPRQLPGVRCVAKPVDRTLPRCRRLASSATAEA